MAPLRDHAIALVAARAAYVRSLRSTISAAEKLSMTADEAHYDGGLEGAHALMTLGNTHSALLDQLLGAVTPPLRAAA